MTTDRLAAIAGVANLYAGLDAELAGLGLACSGCGDCCRFDKADHVLYASRLERLYLAAVEPPFVPASADHEADLLARGLRCPFQRDNRCLARRGRVLGCRLHFCDSARAEALEELAIRYHALLRDLHDRQAVSWDYAPLLPLRDEM